jgi:Gnt-I system low-affinity gluconate transporter
LGNFIDEPRLIAAAIVGMAAILFLILRIKLHAFVALLLGGLLIGVAAGMPLEKVLVSVTDGMANTLGVIAVLVGLGAMFGQMLETSGGADALARALVAKFGEENAPWSLTLTGFLVAIPVFFDVGFIILVPIVYGLTERTGNSIISYGLPLLIGLAAAHAFIPPTPGPIAVATLLQADIGWVILFGAIAGFPAAVLAGPLFGRYVARKVIVGVPDYMRVERKAQHGTPPPLLLVSGLIALPLVLIVGNTLSKTLLPEGNGVRTILMFIGHPMVALLVSTLLCFTLLGTRRGVSAEEVRDLASKALEPAGLIILVTGAGGVLKQILIDSGVGEVLGDMLAASSLPALLLAFLTAAIVRLMQGSATVAMLTAASLVASIVGDADLSQPRLALMVVAIAAGASIASHVNDSGFWLVNRYLGLSVSQTLRTWTVATTLLSLTGLAMTMVIGLFVT